jgi:membrane-bound serine protease (ClpP class)
MRLGCMVLCLVIFTFIAGGGCLSAAAQQEQGWVAIVPVKGEIDEGLAIYLQRVVRDARERGATAIVLEIETFGGRVDAATHIRDVLLEAPIPTVAYVKNRAWSAGALITLANRRIIMHPSASIGAAEPIPATEKTIAALRAEFAATAQMTGRNAHIAEAMVDKTLGYPGIVEKGQILSLTAEQAKTHGIADGISASRGDLLHQVNLAGAKEVEYRPNWSEQLAGWLAQPWVRGFLLSIMFFAVMVEIKTAGLGIGALIGTIAAILFFGGQLVSGLLGWEVPGLFIIGVALVAVELASPGGVLAGTIGFMAIFASLFLALGANTLAAVSLLAAVVTAGLGFALLAKFFPASKLWAKLVLKTAETTEKGFISADDYQQYLGKTGEALTLLRPAGMAEIDGRRLDVVSEGMFIKSGTKIVVVKVEGSRIVVRMQEE